MIEKLENTKSVEILFEGWKETLIYSALQGVMGSVFTDPQNPVTSACVIGDFRFLVGKPDVNYLGLSEFWNQQWFSIYVPQNKAWQELIETIKDTNVKKVERYAIKKEKDVFDKDKLQKICDSLPTEYTIKMIDEELYELSKKQKFTEDFVSQFPTYEYYKKHGLGVVILKDNEIVSGASSYSSYNGGIEIEIETREDSRRKGLASICGARLILECLKRNLYPSWDASNKSSVALAEKLGYHLDHPYTAYFVTHLENKQIIGIDSFN